MPDIAAADVVYSQSLEEWQATKIVGWSRELRRITVTFPTVAGNTSIPAGGVPLSVQKLGFRTFLSSLRIVGRELVVGEANPEWIWDGSNTIPKLLAFETSTAAKQQQQAPGGLNDAVLIVATPQVLHLEVSGW